MTVWQQECFEEYVNPRQLDVEDAGPLLSPIRDFSIVRNEKLALILEILAGDTRQQKHTFSFPAGTVRLPEEKVEFTGRAGMRCTAHGVSCYSQKESWTAEQGKQIRQRAKVQSLTALIRPDGVGFYTIDWLENLDTDSGIWMGAFIEDQQQMTITRTIDGVGGIKFTHGKTTNTLSKCVLEMVVGGVRLYLCGSEKGLSKESKRPGHIVYFGTPDDETRRRIREVLSFCLGNYLIYLGSTTLGEKSELIGLSAVSPPSIGRISEVVSLPPAPLGDMYQNEVNQQTVGRMAGAIYAHYDELQFGSFSWAYWHAMCAPVHMAAAHFGAALEALHSAYMNAHATRFSRVLIPATEWNSLKARFLAAIDDTELDSSTRGILVNRVKSNLNQTPSGVLWEKMFAEIGIALGDVETAAWKRRNLAAHGRPVDNESAIPTIRETKLLKIILHRVVLKITGASDRYHDDYTLGHAVRKITDPITT